MTGPTPGRGEVWRTAAGPAVYLADVTASDVAAIPVVDTELADEWTVLCDDGADVVAVAVAHLFVVPVAALSSKERSLTKDTADAIRAAVQSYRRGRRPALRTGRAPLGTDDPRVAAHRDVIAALTALVE